MSVPIGMGSFCRSIESRAQVKVSEPCTILWRALSEVPASGSATGRSEVIQVLLRPVVNERKPPYADCWSQLV